MRSSKPLPVRRGAGVARYLKEAFLFRWNLLCFLGATAAAALSPWPDALLPLVAAGELSYLAGLVSLPRFRAAVDARAHHEAKGEAPAAAPRALPSISGLVASLPAEGRRRFAALRRRCLEMRSIAQGVGGRAEAGGAAGEEIRTPALDRLLWVFLRLLVSQTALERFLATTSDEEIRGRLDELRSRIAGWTLGGDDRVLRSLEDSVAVHELRLENYRKARANAEFVAIELDRIEGKIQALTEMAVNRQDPNFLTSQVDSVAESMRQTEKAISELQVITGLGDDLGEPPPILESDLREVMYGEA